MLLYLFMVISPMRVQALVALALLALLAAASSQSSVKVSLDPQALDAQEGDEIVVRLVSVSGASSMYAGEFNVTFPSYALSLANVTPGPEWDIFKPGTIHVYVFYRKPSAQVGDNSTIAFLKFKVTANEGTFTINLTRFKAADSGGTDLAVEVAGATTSVTVSRGTTSWGGGGGLSRAAGGEWWIIAAAVAAATLIVVTAVLYPRTLAVPSFALMIDGRVIRFRGSSVVLGREDFMKYLPTDRCSYITRKARGGHFRILYRGGKFYIQDLGSTNGTLVNGEDIRGRGLVPLKNGDVISVPNAFQAIFAVGVRG